MFFNVVSVLRVPLLGFVLVSGFRLMAAVSLRLCLSFSFGGEELYLAVVMKATGT